MSAGGSGGRRRAGDGGRERGGGRRERKRAAPLRRCRRNVRCLLTQCKAALCAARRLRTSAAVAIEAAAVLARCAVVGRPLACFSVHCHSVCFCLWLAWPLALYLARLSCVLGCARHAHVSQATGTCAQRARRVFCSPLAPPWSRASLFPPIVTNLTAAFCALSPKPDPPSGARLHSCCRGRPAKTTASGPPQTASLCTSLTRWRTTSTSKSAKWCVGVVRAVAARLSMPWHRIALGPFATTTNDKR